MRFAVTIALAGVLALSAAAAQAMCVENRSERNIAVVHGEPFDEMPLYYQDMVGPQGRQCMPMPLNAAGKTPMSVYVVDDRGRCKVATGCYYDNADDLNVFVGAGTDGCVASFRVSYCAALK